MKHTTSQTPKRPRRPGPAHAARANIRARRPLHKRMLLHPFTVMVLLCAGVLLAGTTIRSFAVSYDVTATVQAALPGAPAIITSPGPAQHFSVASTTVSGTCPAQSYVKLFRNAAFSGVAQCVSNSYQIQTSLSYGSNELQPQVYNFTDQPGPAGTPLTVYYDETTQEAPAPPASVPTTVSVANVDSSGYRSGTVQRTSDNPTVSGYAPPFSFLTITFHSDPQICYTQANASGWWTCTLDHSLPAGLHHVEIKAVTSSGETLFFPTFQINVLPSLPSLLVTPSTEQLLLRADYHYQVHPGRQETSISVGISGGTAPYAVAVDWGDGTTTNLTRDDTATFSVAHTYPTPAGPDKDYAVLVRATDARNEAALVQLSVVVRGNGIVLLASNTTIGAMLDSLQHWLWVIAPAYITVVLMAIGYYLGEREEYRHLMNRKRTAPAGKAK